MAGINSGRYGKFGSEPITAKSGKITYGPSVVYTTPQFNARTSATRAASSSTKTVGKTSK